MYLPSYGILWVYGDCWVYGVAVKLGKVNKAASQISQKSYPSSGRNDRNVGRASSEKRRVNSGQVGVKHSQDEMDETGVGIFWGVQLSNEKTLVGWII